MRVSRKCTTSPEVNWVTGNCFRMVRIVLKIAFLKLRYPKGLTGRIPLCPIMALARGPYKTTEGQYSPVRLELARLVSSLLYGTRVMLVCFLLKRTSGHLNSKGFLRVPLMTRAKEQAISLKTNSMNVNRAEYK